MKLVTFNIFVTVRAEDEADAAEHLIGELDYIFGADNNLISYTHPGDPCEVEDEPR